MSARINKKRLGGASVILLLLFFVAGGVAKVVNTPAGAETVVVAAEPPAPGGECASQVHFFSADVENNFFGPASDGDVARQQQELHYRRCVDPALVVAHAHEWGLAGFAELNGDDQFAGKTRELINNRDAWRLTVMALEALESESVASIETMDGSYQTLYMLDGLTDVPLIRHASPDRPSFEVIRFVHPDGRVVNLKLDCGFQPVRKEFPGIPPVAAPPPVGQPPAPQRPGKSTTTVPGKTTTTVPGETTTTVPCGRKTDGCGFTSTTVAPPPTTAPAPTTTVAPPAPPPTAAPDPTPPNVTVVNPTIPPRTYTPDGNTGTGGPPTTYAPPATNPGATPGNGGQTTSSR